ncbi:hypothetical protein FRC01_009886 [Tulasnella sp. 417]|nr:hypothetical protein FRC01_009886 [Tulasnella sp. 417]
MDIYSRLGNDWGLGTTLRGLAHIYRMQNKREEAEGSFIQARDCYTRIGDDLGRADALGGLGDIYVLQARFQQAEECFAEAHAVYTRAGNNLGRADTFRGLGNVYRAQARSSDAEGCFNQARVIYFYLGNDRGQGGALRGLGNVYRAQSKYSKAEGAFAEALNLSIGIGDDAGKAGALRGLGNVFRAQARYSEATSSFTRARDLYALIRDEHGQADAIGGLGHVYRRQGSFEEAEEALTQALDIYTRINSQRGQADTLVELGSLYDSQSMYGEAADLFIQAQDIYYEIGDDVRRADILGLLGEMYIYLGMYPEAKDSFKIARDIYTRLGNHDGRENALRGLDKVARAREERHEASGGSIDDDRPHTRSCTNETSSRTENGEPEAAAELSSDDRFDIVSMSTTPVSVNGHFCDVFEGIHSIIGKIALKRPRIAGINYDGDVVRRFEREATTWKRLQHPYILEFLGTLKRDGHLYLVSPFINNGTLVEYVFRNPGVNRIKLLRETAEAIQYLHTQNIIHGDIKGTNILISDSAHVLLCDFGLTRMIDSRTSTCVKGAGSVRWMSPELWDNRPRSFESDVYAFGMTIAEARNSLR